MKFPAVLASLAIVGTQAAAVPPCKHCRQDSCMDAVIKSECGDYLVVVETPATKTVFETELVSVVPTETSFVTLSTTVINDVTTTIPVLAYTTVDYTITVTADVTATNVISETQTITAKSVITPAKRAEEPSQVFHIPEYASACTDVLQYSSACSCVGFVSGTSTAPTPVKISTVTSTVTLATNVVTSAVETVEVTETGSTVPVTTTVSTLPVSRAVETVTTTTIVATTLTTETAFTTVTPVPAPTPTVYLSGEGGIFAEDIRVPPGAEIGVILVVRQTESKAKLAIDPISGSVTLIQATTVPYSLYYYAQNPAFSYIQLTTQRVASIIGVSLLTCSLDTTSNFGCMHKGNPVELWLCGKNLAAVLPGGSQNFVNACAGNQARAITLKGIAA